MVQMEWTIMKPIKAFFSQDCWQSMKGAESFIYLDRKAAIPKMRQRNLEEIKLLLITDFEHFGNRKMCFVR
jgi:hypothetical protein